MLQTIDRYLILIISYHFIGQKLNILVMTMNLKIWMER